MSEILVWLGVSFLLIGSLLAIDYFIEQLRKDRNSNGD